MQNCGEGVPVPVEPVLAQLNAVPQLGAKNTTDSISRRDATFDSPLAEWLPKESKTAHVRVLMPPAGAAPTEQRSNFSKLRLVSCWLAGLPGDLRKTYAQRRRWRSSSAGRR